MKASDQLKNIHSGFDVSNHTFINKLAVGLLNNIQAQIPDIPLKIGGKSAVGEKIKIVISGSAIVADADTVESTDVIVRQTISDLKNPSELLSLLD